MNNSTLTPHNWSVDIESFNLTRDGVQFDEQELQRSDCPSTPKVVPIKRSSKSVTPQSERDNVRVLIEHSDASYSSEKFKESDLIKYGITLLESTSHPLTNLLKNGFEELPWKIIHKEVIFTPEHVMFPHRWEAYKERLTKLSAMSKQNITVKFGTTNSTEVSTNVSTPDGFANWNYHWYPTYASVALMKSALQGLSLADTASARSEDCMSRHAVSLMQNMFFHATGNNHPFRNLLCNDMPQLKPDCAAGPFYFDTASKTVLSAIHTPELDKTAEFLTLFHSTANEHLGTTADPLPIFIGEHKREEDTHEYSDVSKLLIEMKYAREMMELVWEKAPKFNFGYFVGHREWRIFAMRRNEDGQLFATLIFQHRAAHYLDRAYVATVLNQLAVYIHDQLLRVNVISKEKRASLILKLQEIIAQKKAASQNQTSARSSKTTKSSSSTTHTNRSSRSAKKSSPFKVTKPEVKPVGKENKPPNNTSGYNAKQFSVVQEIADNVQIVSCNNQLLARKTGPRDSIKLEAKRLKELKGPYVAPLVWVHKSANYYALATPLYSEVPQPKSVKETVRLSKQLLTALSSLHEALYLHGDVKLKNIVYDYECQRVRFIDLETARQFVSGQKYEFYCGTKTFMAPEMLKREPICEKSDVYSMGLVLACFIYNRRITNTQDRSDILSAVHSLSASPLAPRSLIELVEKMVQQNSAQRISAADALSVCQKIEASLNQRSQPKVSGVSQTKQNYAMDKENIVPKTLAPVQRTPGLFVRK